MSSRLASVAGLRWFILTLILVVSMLAAVIYLPEITGITSQKEPKPYFGVSFNGNTTEQAKLLIDKTKDYTNLFVLQSGPISKNETATNMVNKGRLRIRPFCQSGGVPVNWAQIIRKRPSISKIADCRLAERPIIGQPKMTAAQAGNAGISELEEFASVNR